VLVNPSTGTFLGTAWFRDDRGLNHQSIVCLKCGTVHATTGSPMKALFTLGSRMASVKFYMTPEKLQMLVDEKGPHALERDLALKSMIVDELTARGFINLGFDESPTPTTAEASAPHASEAQLVEASHDGAQRMSLGDAESVDFGSEVDDRLAPPLERRPQAVVEHDRELWRALMPDHTPKDAAAALGGPGGSIGAALGAAMVINELSWKGRAWEALETSELVPRLHAPGGFDVWKASFVRTLHFEGGLEVAAEDLDLESVLTP